MNDIKFDLNISKTDYESIFKKFPTPTYLWQKKDDDLILIDYNNAAKEITDEKIINFLGIKASELYKEQPQILEELYSCINKQKCISREIIYHYQSTGQEKILFVIYDFVSPNLVLVHTKDITEQKKAEEKFRRIFEDSPFSIVLFTLEGKIIDCNPATEKYSGYKKDELVGKDFRDLSLIHPKCLIPLQKLFNKFLKGEKIYNKDIQIYRKNGDMIWINLQASKIKLNGETFFQVNIHNITKQKKADLVIREQIRRLQELNQIQKEFITRASHELKTPLVSIYGATEFLLEYSKKNINDNVIELIEIINRGGKRLKTLIDNLIDISKIVSYKLQLEIERENIVTIIHECVKDVKFTAEKRDLKIICGIQEDIYIDVDRIRIMQVFMNLLINAISNTPSKGRISISVQKSVNFIDISVKDTGVGFTVDEMEKVFKRFGKIERYGKGMDVNTEGPGLGLYISKEIVELHGGKIWVESEGRNMGAKFTIELPIE